jgi:hypothetical protein
VYEPIIKRGNCALHERKGENTGGPIDISLIGKTKGVCIYNPLT